ncbi:hypothetical protein LZ198_28255 [Myxococcus sp. K15C18031901]|uniref:hypothetical protein n=1 Tax=Myxococcus dinghuensis TaxID=2906761 RepID=UPI0020A777BC|nr:hypothetical protein [Myxococcus dinghuensis]MCP3102776.1 hypothetical protein [Myxococcus dinghuensis]
MFIVYGSSRKQQALGSRQVMCPDCQRETPHDFSHTYRVAHVFWFPLFSFALKYARACTRCRLYTEIPPEQVGPVPSPPFMHRMGLLIPMGAVSLCCVCYPMSNLVMGLVLSEPRSARVPIPVAEVEKPGRSKDFTDRFKTLAEDAAMEKVVRTQLDSMGFKSMVVSAASSYVEGPVIRVLTLHWSKMKTVGEEDRLRLMGLLESTVDQHFPRDEAFVGLEGTVFWRGFSFREGGGKWTRDPDDPTESAEIFAVDAIMGRRIPLPGEEEELLEEAPSEVDSDAGTHVADDAVK